jgi:hypothetical protein
MGFSGAPGNQIGGSVAGAGNVLSGNGDAGLYIIAGATGNLVQGNIMGADLTGTASIPNVYEGIYCQDSGTNTIGGTSAGAGNLLSGNTTRGIWFTNSSWNVLQGNLIGTALDGASNLGNGAHAVECELSASHNLIGGPAGAGNRIGWSKTVYAGVRIRAGATNDAILGNAIFSDGALGIDLGTVGITPNDPCDTDAGANQQQNFPVLSQAVVGSATGVRGTLNSAANSTFLLQFFASPVCDSSGNGEGAIYLGDKTVVTTNDCNTGFVASLPGVVPLGYVITATATDSSNNTSEFSVCTPVLPAPPLSIIRPSANQVNLSWTNYPGGFVLKESPNLNAPITWSTVTNVPILNNGQFQVSLVSTQGMRFYLLRFE